VEDRQGREGDNGSLKLAAILLLLAAPSWSAPRWPVGAHHGWGHSVAERSRQDITSVTRGGNSLPAVHPQGSEKVFLMRGASSAMAQRARGGDGARLKAKTGPDVPSGTGAHIGHCGRRLRRPVGFTSIAACRSGERGFLTPMSLCADALLLFVNKVIPEDHGTRRKESAEGQDADWRWLADCCWKPNTRRLGVTPSSLAYSGGPGLCAGLWRKALSSRRAWVSRPPCAPRHSLNKCRAVSCHMRAGGDAAR